MCFKQVNLVKSYMRWPCWSFSWVNSVHCSRCVCVCVCVCVSTAPSVCVSTAPGVCVCVCVCVCAHCSRCVCVCVSTAPGVFVLGWIKYREHISLLVILCIIVYVKKKNIVYFFQYWYPIMVKCLNIGENIGKPIYRSISNKKFNRTILFWI